MSSARIAVLVVDDEPPVLETTAALLTDTFEVHTAANADEAMARLAATPIDVLCTDFNMPGRSGVELIRAALGVYPGMAAVLVTGYREFLDRKSKDEKDVFHLLLKPYRPEQLVQLVDRAAGLARMKQAMVKLNAQLARSKT